MDISEATEGVKPMSWRACGHSRDRGSGDIISRFVVGVFWNNGIMDGLGGREKGFEGRGALEILCRLVGSGVLVALSLVKLPVNRNTNRNR